MLTHAGVYASMALVANAVLLPPSFTADSLGDDNAMETLAINPFKRTVALECPGCDYADVEGKSLSWTREAGSSYLLDFEVGAREDTLDIDNVQLYPPTFGHFSEPFYVTQVNRNKEAEGTRLRVTGYTFHYNSAETVTEAGTELLPMTFRITSIESKNVNPPAIIINLLKDVRGHLMIASFQTAQAEEETPENQEKECKEWPLLCKWKSILADKINGMKNSIGKPCHKHHKGIPKLPAEAMEEMPHGKPPHNFQPGHPHHHKPHHFGHHSHRNHHHHRLHMFFRRAFFTIFIPILIGIFAGTLTYLIGMALGCLIAITVAKIRGRAPYEPIVLEDEEEAVQPRNEKEAYVEPPHYDAPPVYEEAPEKEVVEETK